MLYKLVVDGPPDREFRVLEWHFKEGSSPPANGLLVELETPKCVVEVRLRDARVLRKIFTREDEWQYYGQPIAVLADEAAEPVPPELGGDVLFAVTDLAAV